MAEDSSSPPSSGIIPFAKPGDKVEHVRKPPAVASQEPPPPTLFFNPQTGTVGELPSEHVTLTFNATTGTELRPANPSPSQEPQNGSSVKNMVKMIEGQIASLRSALDKPEGNNQSSDGPSTPQATRPPGKRSGQSR